MNNLSVNVATHALLLKDGSKKFINKRAYDVIWKKFIQGEKEILINDWMISTDKIAEIVSLEEFSQRFPEVKEDLLPAPQLKSVEQLAKERGMGLEGVIDKYKSNNAALKGMIKGMKAYLAGRKQGECKNTEALLEKMEGRLAVCEKVNQ